MENHASQVDKPHAGKIACEVVLGTIGGFVGYMLGIFSVNVLCPLLFGNERIPTSIVIVVSFSIFLGIAIMASLAVYFAGKIVKHRSSYLFTLLGGGLGIGIYIAIIFIMNALGLCPS